MRLVSQNYYTRTCRKRDFDQSNRLSHSDRHFRSIYHYISRWADYRSSLDFFLCLYRQQPPRAQNPFTMGFFHGLSSFITGFVAPIFIIISPITSYADQTYAIHRAKSSAGFSLDIPLIMLVASILRYLTPDLQLHALQEAASALTP